MISNKNRLMMDFSAISKLYKISTLIQKKYFQIIIKILIRLLPQKPLSL